MSIVRDSLVMLTWRAAAIGIGLVTTVLLARWLGPEDRGSLAILVLSLTLVTLVLQFGVPEALIYVLGARLHGESEILSTVLVYSLAVSVAAAVLAIVALRLWTDLDGVTRAGLVVAGCLSMQTTYARHLLLGAKAFAAYSSSVIAEGLAYLAGLVGCWSIGGLTVPRAVWAYAVSLGIAAALAWATVVARAAAKPSFTALCPRVITDSLGRGMHLFLTGLGSFGAQRLSYFLLEAYAGVRAVGLYTAAATVPSLFANVPQQVATVLYSHVAGRRGDESRVESVIAVVQLLTIVAVVVLVPVVAFADEIALLLFGAEFAGIGAALVLLSIAMAFAGIASVIFNAMAGEGMHRYGSYLTLLTLVAVACLGWWWIPRHGLEGAAAAQLVAGLLGLVFIVAAYNRATGTPLAAFLKLSPEAWRTLVSRSASGGMRP
jgi:O-antigen/teichoic acid export membrane protein